MLDPLQFAYRTGKGVEDAKLFILNELYKHLEKPGAHARVLFADFSSAFNTIQPHILANKLISNFRLDNQLILWVIEFLTNRSQRVLVNGRLSDSLQTSTGSPQGCVLSPLLYILYTDDCRSNHEGRHIVKFADDSALVSLLIGPDQQNGPVLDEFVNLCDNSYLNLNVDKTKEIVFDFRRQKQKPVESIIHKQEVEIVHNYTYLGSIFDHKLTWDANTEAILKKGKQRLYFLRKLESFSVNETILSLFYKSFIESVITFSFILCLRFLCVYLCV